MKIMNIVDKLQLNEMQKFAKQNYIPVVQDGTCNFLFSQVEKLQPKTILEIGTAIGYSGIVLLNACKTAHLTTIELDGYRFNLASQNFEKFNLTNRCTQILGDAKTELKKLHNKFDFVFLDGPKGQYLSYLPLILNLLNVGGVIFCDNINFNNMVQGDFAVPHKKRTIVVNLRKFKQEITTRNDLETNFYEIGDGVAIIKKLM